MAITTTEYISLDFYNSSIANVNAKYGDAESRYINITCTDHGKKIELDSSLVSAFIRYEKSDGNFIFNDTEILNNGTINVKLTEQMLNITGRYTVDVMIVSLTNVPASDLESMQTIYDMGGTVISTMNFYLTIVSSPINMANIESTNEYSGLTDTIARMVVTDKNLRELESTIESKEEERQAAEKKRQDNVTGEAYRIANEKQRVSKTNELTTTINDAKTTLSDMNSAKDKTVSATQECNTATQAAKDAVEEFKTIKDGSGIITSSEKGSPNGVATLDSNGKVTSSQLNLSSFTKNNLTTTSSGYVLDARQGKILNDNISTLNDKVSALPTIRYNDTVDNSIGINGDILFVPVD